MNGASMWKEYKFNLHEAKMGELLKYVGHAGGIHKMRAPVRKRFLRLRRYSARADRGERE